MTLLPEDIAKAESSRPHITYTLPMKSKLAAAAYAAAGFSDADLTFKIVEVKPHQQDKCAKLANGNTSVLGREMMFASLWRIGDWKPAKERDRLESWWDAIGAANRKLIEAAFLELQSVEEAEVDTFLDSGVPSVS